MPLRSLNSAFLTLGRPSISLSRSHRCVCTAWRLGSPARELSSQASSEKPYLVTTPIFYVNAAPHVGHLYTIVLADILKRWQLLKGRKAILCTGTDEHGMKVQQASSKADMEPQPFCDRGAAVFKHLAQQAGVAYDHFVRTTDAAHREAVEHAWIQLEERGWLHTAKHEGWYSVGDEAFYPASAVHTVLDPATGRKMVTSIETGSEVEWTSELNYRFRLSAFRERLLDFYRQNPAWAVPAHRMKEVVDAVECGLEDLSVSRPSARLSWGIRVPGDATQTVYVWFDALLNYATKAGYPWQPGLELAGGWPADQQVIGKDIMRFHCIYWPAFLMALELPLPKQILTHSHWTLGGKKMSKSTGITVDPFGALKRFGSDALRFYLAYEGRLRDDAVYDVHHVISCYTNLLQGGLGNLATRVLRSKKWALRGAVERVGRELADSRPVGPGRNYFVDTLEPVAFEVEAAFAGGSVSDGVARIAGLIRSTNSFFHMSHPWTEWLDFPGHEPGPSVDRTVFLSGEGLRLAGILLQPIMPTKAAMLLDQLGVDESRRSFEFAQPCSDLDYGIPKRAIGQAKSYKDVLFEPLSSDQ